MKGDCNICVNGKLPSDSATCVECGLSRKNYKPITNADRIRSMSDEELAEFMRKGCDEMDCPGIPFPADTPFAKDASDEQCRKCWLGWLKQEVSDAD